MKKIQAKMQNTEAFIYKIKGFQDDSQQQIGNHFVQKVL